MWKRSGGNGRREIASRGLNATDRLTSTVLATMSSHIAIVDRDGNIIAANEAWNSFRFECGDSELQRPGVGSNYLEARQATDHSNGHGAAGATLGIRAVLAGSRPHFSAVYGCQSPSGRRWFRMTATPIGSPPHGATISHTSVPEPRPADEALTAQTITPAATAEQLLGVLTEYMAKMVGARIGFMSEVVDQRTKSVRIVARWDGEDGGFDDSLTYETEGLPAHDVLQGASCLHPANVQLSFPHAACLKEIAAECYLSVPLFDSTGTIIGALGLVHDRSLDDFAFAEQVVRTVGTRASPELERLRLVRSLERSERTARALLNAPVDSAFLLEPDGTIVDLNEVAAVRLGLTVAEATGKNVFDLFPPEVTATRRAAADEVLTTRKPLRMEDERAGMHFESLVYPVLDSQGNVEKVAIFASNITARKVAEEQLRGSEEKYRSFIESSVEGIVCTDSDGHIAFTNAAAQRMFGYDPGELDGETIEILVPQRFRDEHVGDRSRYTSHPQARPMGKGMALAGRRKDGTEFPVEISLSPTEGPQGGLIMAVISDISERELLQAELSRSEKLYHSLVETIPHGIGETDLSGVITYANRAHHRQYEYGEGELIGMSMLDFVATDSERETLLGYLQYLAKEQPSPTRYTGQKRTKSGKIIDVEVNWDYRRDERGQVTGFISIITDITARKAAEDEAHRAAQRNATLLEAIPDMIFTLDRRGIFVDFVPADGLEPFASPEQFLGRTMFEVLPTSLAQKMVRGIELALDTGHHQQIEYDLDLDDGKHQYETRILKSKEEEVLAIVRDVTAAKRQEREGQLIRARDELEGRIEKEMLGKNPYGLTFREFTVLHLAANGAADKEIADQLGISTFTVSKHVANFLGKMAATSRTEACVRALREGLLT